MEFDPHFLHQILLRIGRQMRCPQCTEHVAVELANIRMTGDDFLLMQMQCHACGAYIVLHASLKGCLQDPEVIGKHGINASSYLCTTEQEIDALRCAIAKSKGSFGSCFKDMPGVMPGDSMIA